jgi:undecaprenyl pyrophosphate synthase
MIYSPAYSHLTLTSSPRYPTLRNVALIPDGNRRWARRENVSLDQAYDAVAQTLRRISAAIFQHNVESLSVYILSKDNLDRDPTELIYTFRSHIRILRNVLPELAIQWQAHVFHIGDDSILPTDYKDALNDVRLFSEQTSGLRRIYLYAGYSVGWELSYILELQSQKVGIHQNVPGDIDLLIRSGGEKRLSGFCPIQVQYAEFFFLEKLFPDIETEDIEQVIQEYYSRNRRFGK